MTPNRRQAKAALTPPDRLLPNPKMPTVLNKEEVRRVLAAEVSGFVGQLGV